MKKLGLYIHIPFCESKCYYCDFYSITKIDKEIKSVYVDSLIKELKLYKDKIDGDTFDTIFIGGGTPSTIDAEIYSKMFEYLYNEDLVNKDAEITMEINPKNRGLEYLNKIKKNGVNRLSVGIQTFDDEILKVIGRNHNKKEAERFLESVNNVGFENLSCDLIFNLPLQKFDHIKKDIDKLERFYAKHISLYSLKVNPNTKMNEIVKKETYKLMEDEEERDTYYLARNYMKSKGYNQYEISNFAKKGYESKHNLKYWDRAEYIGIGASAHSFLENKRYSNVSNVDEYIKSINSCKLPIDYEEYINKEDALWEFLILGLRKSEGVNIEEMETKFNTSFSKYREIIKELNDDGLLIRTKENIKLTKKGMDLSNYVFVKLK